MGYYPIVFDVTDRPCLVVGGGEIALRKVEALAAAGACVSVISPGLDPRIEAIYGVNITRREFQPGDTAGFALVFAATDDRGVNIEISREASERGVPINVVDDPELCSFIVPSVVHRGDLMIAVTTSGKSPTLSKRLRRKLEDIIGPEYEPYVNLLGEMRERVKCLYHTQPEREAALVKLIDNPEILNLVRNGQFEEAREIALSCI